MKQASFIITDNNGETYDQYSLLVRVGREWDIYNMSANAMMPNGVNLYNCTLEHDNPTIAGAIVSYSLTEMPKAMQQLPEQVQQAIKERIASYLVY